VPEVRRNTKFALVALAGAAVGAVLARFRRPAEAPAGPPDDRTEELRRKLAEARAAVADENDFEVAGMGAETVVEEPPAEPAPAPAAEAPPAAEPEPAPPPTEEAKAEPAPEEPAAKPPAKRVAKPKETPPAEAGPPPRDEFEAMRRRIHEEGKAAADEMRRSAEKPDKP
jgi:outer membrane biosynthesis protein TonB